MSLPQDHDNRNGGDAAPEERPPAETSLLPQHAEDLRNSGLSDEQVRDAGLYSLTDCAEVGRVLKWKGSAARLGPCLVFPFFEADGSRADYFQVKPDNRTTGKTGKAAKYLSPVGVPIRVYVPPTARECLADPATPLLITEGVKKVLKATQEGFPGVGLVGVDCWSAPRTKGPDGRATGRRQLHADLTRFPLAGRVVRLVFDSDAATNNEVRRALNQLAVALRRVGAKPIIVRLPAGPGGAKCGLDDFLHANGADALHALFADSEKTGQATAPPSDDGGDGDDGSGRKENGPAVVMVREAEHLTNDMATAALARSRGLYQRGELLVRMASRPSDESRQGRTTIHRPAGARVVTHDADTLREELTRVAAFVKERTGADGEQSIASVHPPGWCVKAVVKRKFWPGVPDLTAIVSYPVLLPGGRVLTREGYDPDSGVYLAGDFNDLPIPPQPTRRDAVEAAKLLADVVCDFPFQLAAHKSAWVAAVLTPLARYAYCGPTPLFLFDANIRGAGKSLLADLVAAITTGGDFARTSYTADKVEMRKLITTMVAAGDPLILFDNVTGRFGDASLDAALTGTKWSDRLLGTNQRYEGPLTAVFYASGNNCDVGADAARRVLPCRIESEEEAPEDRDGFKYRLPEWATANRGRLLAAALTILKAYDLAGRPEAWDAISESEATGPLKPWGSYGGWSALVRSALVWAGMADPAEAKDHLRESADRDAVAMRGLLAELAALHPDGASFTTREVAKSAGGDEVKSGWEAVADLLVTLDATTAGKMGYKFRHYQGRNFAGRSLMSGKKGNAGQKWSVVMRPRKNSEPDPSSPSSPDSSGGEATPTTTDDCTHHRHSANGVPKSGARKDFGNETRSSGDDGDDESGREKTTPPPGGDSDDAGGRVASGVSRTPNGRTNGKSKRRFGSDDTPYDLRGAE